MTPSQQKISPVSSPDVPKSQDGGSAHTTSAPAGTTGRSSPHKRRDPSRAKASPVTDNASPSRTAAQFRDTPGTRSGSTSNHPHSAEVVVSTRSPMLNTGPFPATICRTVRRTIRPSSLIHRRSQIRTAQTSTGPPTMTAFHGDAPPAATAVEPGRTGTDLTPVSVRMTVAPLHPGAERDRRSRSEDY